MFTVDCNMASLSLKQASTVVEDCKMASLSLKQASSTSSVTNKHVEDPPTPFTPLSAKIQTFAETAMERFIEKLTTLEYNEAHAWLKHQCQTLHNEIQFKNIVAAKSTPKTLVKPQSFSEKQLESLAKSRQAEFQQLKHQLHLVLRATGPPPVPADTSKNGGRFVQRRVPADNSCLFHCIQRIYRSGNSPQTIRRQCVDYVNSNKQELSMVAGTEFVNAYEKSMGDDKTWGGAFEINAQCVLRRVRITLFDCANTNEQTFGESLTALTAAYIIRVDGNHFDYLAYVEDHQDDRNVFSIYDETARRRARRKARQIQESSANGGGRNEWRVDGQIKSVPMLRQTSWE